MSFARCIRRGFPTERLLFLCLLLSAGSAWAQEPETRRDTLVESQIVARRSTEGLSSYRIDAAQLSRLIAPLGEADVVKQVQRLPGVSFTMEGTSAFSVRGGNMGNNQLSLDGVTLYGISHLMGLTTVVPSEILSDTEFCVGGFESGDGNLLSSHIRMKSADGDFQRAKGTLSLSNLMASAFVTTPIVKEKLSATVSARWSPAQLEYNALAKRLVEEDSGLPRSIKAGVYDFYGKLDWRPAERHQLSLSWLRTDDHYAFTGAGGSSRDSLGWSNNLILLHWNGEMGRRLTLSADVSANTFGSTQMQDRTLSANLHNTSLGVQSRVQEYQAAVTADLVLTRPWAVRLGADYRHTVFKPAAMKSVGSQADDWAGADRSHLAALHGQLSYETSRMLAWLALRLNGFQSDDRFRRLVPEWRLRVNYFFNDWLGVEGTYDRMAQFYHTLEGTPTGITLDMIVPAGAYAEPEKADQVYLGLMAHDNRGWSFSAGGYAKWMSGLVYYADAGQFFNLGTLGWKENLDIGTGRSYGLELLLQKNEGPLTGQLAYTLSKTDRTFPGINEGQPFPYKFDRRHMLNADASYRFAEKQTFSHGVSAAFTCTSGHYETLQAGWYLPYGLPIEDALTYYTHPNNYRLPAYIRLDLSYNMTIKGKRARHDITLGVYNVLNRHNAYSLTWDAEAGRWKQLSILPILPSLKYALSF